MAHNPTREEIDQLAAQEAQAITAADQQAAQQAAADAPPAETTLAYGAEGECVTKLVDLLAVLGYTTNTVIKGGPPILDESVLADVRAAQQALEVKEPELTLPADIPVGVKGELVGAGTWNRLYAAAATKLEPAAKEAAAPAGGAASAA